MTKLFLAARHGKSTLSAWETGRVVAEHKGASKLYVTDGREVFGWDRPDEPATGELHALIHWVRLRIEQWPARREALDQPLGDEGHRNDMAMSSIKLAFARTSRVFAEWSKVQ